MSYLAANSDNDNSPFNASRPILLYIEGYVFFYFGPCKVIPCLAIIHELGHKGVSSFRGQLYIFGSLWSLRSLRSLLSFKTGSCKSKDQMRWYRQHWGQARARQGQGHGHGHGQGRAWARAREFSKPSPPEFCFQLPILCGGKKSQSA